MNEIFTKAVVWVMLVDDILVQFLDLLDEVGANWDVVAAGVYFSVSLGCGVVHNWWDQ